MNTASDSLDLVVRSLELVVICHTMVTIANKISAIELIECLIIGSFSQYICIVLIFIAGKEKEKNKKSWANPQQDFNNSSQLSGSEWE